MDTYRWTRAEVDLDALHHNLEQFRIALGPDIKIMAVVKANAYGHGAVKVAEEAIRHGVEYLAVAFLDEALELRHFGIEAPILVLGYTPAAGVEVARDRGITLTVFDDDVLEAAASQDPTKTVNIHVKVDTGMGRIGLTDEQDAIRFVEKALRTPGVAVEGLFTHYACADECDKTHVTEQYRKFARIADHFQRQGISFKYVHAGNSATGIDTPDYTRNMLRLGVSMYGLYPSEEVDHERVQLKPVMSLKSGVVMVKRLPQGSTVSYGANYATARDGETIATLPIGYADGYSRLLTGKAEALLRGKRVPVVGNICMDQCMVRVDDGEAEVGEEVVLFGTQGGETIPVEELAAKLGTINYEITCMVSHRVPRVYVKGGRVTEFDNPLLHFTNEKSIRS
ncbi:alanine racemase [Paenibacillus sp.]|uniref:alanine racemase n=1 Tax=Paenibacillus sp. TaxID=58172 RepID=UPI0028115C18|nr:alanine racemase [Paenibacillus sp.]